MKVKMNRPERFSKKDTKAIPLPPNFSYSSGSRETGAALVIVDNITNSKYRWLPNDIALELINSNLAALKPVVDDATYEEAKNKCEALKETLSVCKAVFQKLTEHPDKSMTFRYVL